MTVDKLNFEQLYAQYQFQIHCYLTRFIGAKEAEDLTQEVFIKAGKSLIKFRNESQVLTWLYRIATNAAIDRTREPSFRREIAVDQLKCGDSGDAIHAFVDADSNLAKSRPSLEEKSLRNATNQCIRGIIDKLPENYRVPVILSELEGLPNQEIAEILGLSLEMVKARLHRGKARLRKELLNACQFSRDERNELTCDPKETILEKSKPGTL